LAITREKQLKGLLRNKKDEIISNNNSKWLDLSESWYGDSSLCSE